jgi:hypothetical protein
MSLFIGCMEGPAGPAGAGGSGAPKDSVVIDLMKLGIYFNKHIKDTISTGFQMTAVEENRYAGFDTSMFVWDSVVDLYGSRYLDLLVKTKYPPSGWSGFMTIKNVHECDEKSDSIKWFAKFSRIETIYSEDTLGIPPAKIYTPQYCVKNSATPSERKQYYGAYYYPGKGLSLTYAGMILPSGGRDHFMEGTLTLYYW